MAALRLCVIFLALATMSRCFLLDDNSLQNLLNLITEEKKLRSSVEQEINLLRKDIDNMKANHQHALCKCSAAGVVAFSATLTKDITNFGTHQPIVFDKVITNVGGAYDSRHGSFRAPVNGIYKLSFSVLQGQSTMWIGVELVKDGAVIARVKTGDNGYWNMGTNVITAHLNAGDDVWVRHMSDSDNKQVVAQSGYFTSFSGHLIHSD
ncbi:complement C1q-like protein 4 [Mercenaria mercenaria]|uniref:complement C1q-like protein 4 n=1 Tax=Mercenaria mercenaria TaxID=6596 RepID=UPI001E1DA262|nr:complement C1q-like protein 4 [Mercenaria mercenaria]